MNRRTPPVVWAQRASLFLLVLAILVVSRQTARRSAAEVTMVDGSAWLVNPQRGEVVLINHITEEITARVEVAKTGDQLEAVQLDHDALVLNRSTGTLGRVDGARLSFAGETLIDENASDLTLIANAEQPYVINTGTGDVLAIDPLTLNVLSSIETSAGTAAAIVDQRGRLWIADQDAGSVIVLDELGQSRSIDIGEPNEPFALALIGDTPMLVDPKRAAIVPIDETGDDRSETCLSADSEGIVASGTASAIDPPMVFAVASKEHAVHIADIADATCRVLDLGSEAAYGKPVLAAHVAYIPVHDVGRVIIVAGAETGTDQIRSIRVVPEGENFEVFAKAGAVWFNNLDGPEAGVIQWTGETTRFLKYDDGTPGFGARALGDGSLDESLLGEEVGADGAAVELDAAGDPVLPALTTTSTTTQPSTPNEAADGEPPGDTDGETPSTTVADNVFRTTTTTTPEVGDPPVVETDIESPPQPPLTDEDLIAVPAADRPEDPEETPTPEPPEQVAPPEAPLAPISTTTTAFTPGVTTAPTTTTTIAPERRPAPTNVAVPVATTERRATTTTTEPPTRPSTTVRAPARPTTTIRSVSVTPTLAPRPAATFAPLPAQRETPASATIGANTPSAPAERQTGERQTTTTTDRSAQLRANFTFTASRPGVGTTVVFTDQSIGSPQSWTWDFGDGTRASGPKVTKSWGEPGQYIVVLTVTDGDRTDSNRVVIRVLDPERPTRPSANLRFSADTGEVGDILQFVDSSAGAPTSWVWDWGDDTTSTGPVVRHSWREPGEYLVVLTVTNESGTDQARQRITIVDKVQPPEALFDLDLEIVEVGRLVTVTDRSTGNPTAIEWDFGDGTLIGGRQVSHAYDEPGTYTVELEIENSLGTSTATKQIVVQQVIVAPVASFVAEARETAPGVDLTFTSTANGNPEKIAWSFGDGTTESGPAVSHAWDEPGTYPVTLYVENDAGTDETTITVTVKPVRFAPTARFAFTPDGPVAAGEIVEFVESSLDNPTEWLWDFGDGTTSSEPNPSHVFSDPDTTYSVTLTVANDLGTDSLVREIVTNPLATPQAEFSFSPEEPRVGNPIRFADLSTGDAVEWTWELDNERTSTIRNPTHVFSEPGRYEVRLTTNNEFGADTVTRTVVVGAASRRPPTAFFDHLPTRPKAGESVDFIDFTNGNVTTPVWDFNLGDVASAPGSKEISHTFDNAGTHIVHMRVCWIDQPDVCSVFRKVVPVQSSTTPPVASFELGGGILDPLTVQVGEPIQFNDTSSGGDISGRTWTIDGQTFETQEAIVTFESLGSKEIALAVTNGAGTDVETRTIEVVDASPPDAAFSIDSPISVVGEIVSFIDRSDGSVGEWAWTFGDEGTAAVADPTHVFTEPGTYRVRLEVSNEWGTDVAERSVEIEAIPSTTQPPPSTTTTSEPEVDPNLPNPEIGGIDRVSGEPLAFPVSIKTGTLMTLSDVSPLQDITEWRWELGDGTTVSGRSISHFYTVPGLYTVRLTVTSAEGTVTETTTIQST